MEVEAKKGFLEVERRDLTKKEDSFMSLFVAYLRWSEGFIMNAARLRHRIGKGRDGPLDHLVIPFMGRFNGGDWEMQPPTNFFE